MTAPKLVTLPHSRHQEPVGELLTQEIIHALSSPGAHRSILVHVCADRAEEDRCAPSKAIETPAVRTRRILMDSSEDQIGKCAVRNAPLEDEPLLFLEGLEVPRIRSRVALLAGGIQISYVVRAAEHDRDEVVNRIRKLAAVRTAMIVHCEKATTKGLSEFNALIADDAGREYERQLRVYFRHRTPPKCAVTPGAISVAPRHPHFSTDYSIPMPKTQLWGGAM